MNVSLKSYLIILLTLLVGFGAGFMTNGYLLRRKVDRIRRLMEGRERVADQLIQDLGLSEAQADEIRPILVSHLDTVHGLQRQFRRDLHQERQSLMERLQPHLKPEQLEQLKRKMRFHLHRRKPKGEGPNRPPPDL